VVWHETTSRNQPQKSESLVPRIFEVGYQTHNAKNVKALSWTLNRDTAEWFAHRFDEHGTVYEAQIPKEHIYAVFLGRNEAEVIVDPKHLQGITPIQEQSEEFQMKGFEI